MAAGGRDSLERRLFHQAYISPLAVVRDFFEALSELRGAVRGPENGRYILASYPLWITLINVQLVHTS